jgi:hypothetical protein
MNKQNTFYVGLVIVMLIVVVYLIVHHKTVSTVEQKSEITSKIMLEHNSIKKKHEKAKSNNQFEEKVAKPVLLNLSEQPEQFVSSEQQKEEIYSNSLKYLSDLEEENKKLIRNSFASYIAKTGIDEVNSIKVEGTFEHIDYLGVSESLKLKWLRKKPGKILELRLNEKDEIVKRLVFMDEMTQIENLQDEDDYGTRYRKWTNPGNDYLLLSLPKYERFMESAEEITLTDYEMQEMFPAIKMFSTMPANTNEEEISERKCIKVCTPNQENLKLNMYFDSETSLLIGYQILHGKNGKLLVSTYISDYKEYAPGIQLPSNIIVYNKEWGEYKISINEAVPNVDLADEKFKLKPYLWKEVEEILLDSMDDF